GSPEPLREHARVVARDAHRRLAALQPDRRRPARVARSVAVVPQHRHDARGSDPDRIPLLHVSQRNRGHRTGWAEGGYIGSPHMANETINDPRIEEGVWTTDPESGELVPDYESTFPTIEEGQVVNGTVVRVDKDEVLVDIGYKSEGVIPVSELSIRRS